MPCNCPLCGREMIWFGSTLFCIKCDWVVIRELAQDKNDRRQGWY